MKKTLLSLLLLLAISVGTRAQEIFDMPGATATYLTGINDSGEICGYYTVSSGAAFGFAINKFGDTIRVAYPGSYNYITVEGINNKGMLCGTYGSSSNTGAVQGFVFLPNPGRNNGGTYVDVTTGKWGGTNIKMGDVTEDTCFAGGLRVSNHDDGAAMCNSEAQVTALRCNNQGTIYPTYFFARDNSGNLGGYIVQGGSEQCCIYRAGVWDTFSIAGNNKSRVYGMNDNGWICGNYSNTTRGYFSKKLSGQNLQGTTNISISGSTTVFPLDINNKNELVGYFTDATGTHGFIIATYDIGFLPSRNGFPLRNDGSDSWTPSYYANINYNTDPYFNDGITPFPKDNYNHVYTPARHDSWRDVGQTLTENTLYITTQGTRTIKQSTFQLWKTLSGTGFQGGCFGYTNAAALLYDEPAKFFSFFPSAIGYQNLNAFNFPRNDTTRLVANQMQAAYTYSKVFTSRDAAAIATRLSVTMQELKQELRNSRTRPHKVLGIILQDGSGGHAVFPYKLVPDRRGFGVDTIYIYDSNYPGQDNLFMSVDLRAGSGNWKYNANGQRSEAGNSSLGVGLYLQLPDTTASRRLEATLKQNINHFERSNGYTTIYFNDSSVVHITDDNDSTAVFSADSNIYSGLILGRARLSGIVGMQTKSAFSFSTTATLTKTTRTGYEDNFVALSDEDYFIRCDKMSGTDSTDNFVITSGTADYTNPTGADAVMNYTVVRDDSSTEFNYFVNNVHVAATGRTVVSKYGTHGMRIQNYGPATSYTITTQFITDAVHVFTDTLSLAGNTEQIIQPHDTTASGIYVLVDNGMDGSIEDTIFVNQTLTAINRIEAPQINAWPVPTGNELNISGPQGEVAYTITDVQGRLVANGKLNFGNGNTQKLDVSNLGAGIYLLHGESKTENWNYRFVR